MNKVQFHCVGEPNELHITNWKATVFPSYTRKMNKFIKKNATPVEIRNNIKRKFEINTSSELFNYFYV